MSSSASDQVPAALDVHEVEVKLSGTPEWTTDMDTAAISRTVQLKSFDDAMAFVHAVAQLAEEHHHHPDILISYKTVTLTLTTHDAGGLTDKDFLLASHIDRLSLPDATGNGERFLAG